MTISSEALPLQSLFQLGRFEPALAQRAYEWEERHWGDLLNDLLGSFAAVGLDPGQSEDEDTNAERIIADDDDDESSSSDYEGVASQIGRPIIDASGAPPSNYFLGQMVFWPRPNGGYLIYDGQQRLTSLTLLLCTLRDLLGGDGAWQPLQELLRTHQPDKLARVTLGKGSRLTIIVDSLNGTKQPENFTRLSPENQRLYTAAGYFTQRLRKWQSPRIHALIKFLRERVMVVVTLVQERRLAETAYLTLNTRGAPLKASDILKGHLVQFVAQFKLTEADQIALKWDSLARQLGELDRPIHHTGKSFDDFLRIADFHWFGRFRTADFGLQIMDQFREEAQTASAIEWVSDELPRLLGFYKELRSHETMDEVGGYPLCFRKLSFLKWRAWVPMAIAIMEGFPKESDSRMMAMKALERWCFVVNLLDWDEKKISERIAGGIAQYRERNPFARNGVLFITSTQKTQARRRLENGQFESPERRRAYVRWLETQLWGSAKVPYRATGAVTVEHVLPRRADGQWEKDFPQNISIFAEKIGNLCLVPKDNLEATQYTEKRANYQNFAPIHRSAHDVEKSEHWNAAAVDDRTARMVELSVKALRI